MTRTYTGKRRPNADDLPTLEADRDRFSWERELPVACDVCGDQLYHSGADYTGRVWWASDRSDSLYCAGSRFAGQVHEPRILIRAESGTIALPLAIGSLALPAVLFASHVLGMVV